MRRAPTIVLLLCLLPRPALAQRAFEIAGGYSLARDPRDEVTLPAGWMAGVGVDLTRTFSAIADISGQYKTLRLFDAEARIRVHAAMGGVRASARIGRLTEFGQIAAGVVQASGSAFGATTTGHSWSIQPGVGVDYPFAKVWAARVGLDVRLTAAQPEAQNAGLEYRVVAGLVYRSRPR